MSDAALVPALPAVLPTAGVTPLPLRELLPWAVLALLLAVIVVYFVGAEQGATSVFSGGFVHEFTHDGRHLLGFPCH